MIVITRNGKQTVYTGWKEWLIGAGLLVAAWVVLAVVVFLMLGFAVTIGLMALLALPAIVIVAVIGRLTQGRA